MYIGVYADILAHIVVVAVVAKYDFWHRFARRPTTKMHVNCAILELCEYFGSLDETVNNVKP